MGQKIFEKNFVESLVNLIRLTTSTDKEVEEKYNFYIKNENLTPYQKKYFKSLMFDKIDYSDTWKKMQHILKKDINHATFSGKELKNIQRFFREQKLNNLR